MIQVILKNVLRLWLQNPIPQKKKFEKLNENLYGSVQQTDL